MLPRPANRRQVDVSASSAGEAADATYSSLKGGEAVSGSDDSAISDESAAGMEGGGGGGSAAGRGGGGGGGSGQITNKGIFCLVRALTATALRSARAACIRIHTPRTRGHAPTPLARRAVSAGARAHGDAHLRP